MSTREYTNAREFDRRATFQRQSQSRTTSGAVEFAWVNVCTAWCSLIRQKLSERLKEPYVADAVQSVRDYVMRIRADVLTRNSIDETCRVVIDDVTFEIKAISDNVKSGRVIDLAIRAGMNNG